MKNFARTSTQWSGDEKDLHDFRCRWRRARFSTLSSILGRAVLTTDDEEKIIREIASQSVEVQEAALKAVFHVGGLLSSGMTRFFNREWTLGEVTYFLGEAGHPCFTGAWSESSEHKGLRLSRTPCASRNEPFVCRYWREAADGVVTGLSDHIFFSRHTSAASGDETCEDWIYVSRHSPLKFGPIPLALQAVVSSAVEHYSLNKVVLQVLGYSEGTVYYNMNMKDGTSLCGLGKTLWENDFKRRILEAKSDVKFMDVSPRAVLPEGA
jgi:hypothetical protein